MHEFALVYFSFILIIILIFTKNNKDIFNPLIVFFTPLFANYNIYYFMYKNDYEISNLSVILLICGVTAYLIGCTVIMLSRVIKNDSKSSTGLLPVYRVNSRMLKAFLIIGIIGFIDGLNDFFYYGLTGSSNFLINVRYNSVYGDGISNISKYGTMLLFIVTCVYVYKYKEGYSKKMI